MQLLRPVVERGIGSVAVVGMCKNCGKTVSLNRLVQEASTAGLSLGLTSAGLDGEQADIIWGHRKPAVWVPRGAVLATAREVLGLGSAVLEVLEETGFVSALGAVCIARAKEAGTIQLAGPAAGKEIAAVISRLTTLGAGLVLVDGALDRAAAAAPTVADGLILAAGAALSSSPERVLAQTRVRLEQLTVPRVADGFLGRGTKGAVTLWLADDSLEDSGYPSALGHEQEIALGMAGRAKGLVLQGALTDGLISALVERLRGPVAVVVQDGTRIFVSPHAWKNFLRQGGRVEAIRPITLLAVTLNPWSPGGWEFDAAEFLTLGRSALGNVPVFDPCQLEKEGEGVGQTQA